MNIPSTNSKKVQNNHIKHFNVTYFVDLVLDIWRLRKRISKLGVKNNNEKLKPIYHSLDSCERSLRSMGFETKDYTGDIYQTSMNVDVVSYESTDIPGDDAKVKEIIEPAILFDNKLLHKAKVIVITPKP